MTLIEELPNFPFVITDQVIRACGEPGEQEGLLIFGLEAFWCVYAWKHPSPDMDWWDVLIVEADELIVSFHVPIGQHDSFAYNIYAAPIMSRMRSTNWVQIRAIGGEVKHPLWGKYPQRRGCLPHNWYRLAGICHDPFLGAVPVSRKAGRY